MSATPVGKRTFVCVDVDGGRYGIDARWASEVTMLGAITPVPGAPAFVQGVATYHGRVVPVIDAGRRLSLARAGVPERRRAVIVESARGASALLVDDVLEIADIADSAIDPVPAMLATENGSLYEGVARLQRRLVGLLNVPAVLDFEMEATGLQEGEAATSPTPQGPARHRPEPDGTRPFAVLRVGRETYALEAEGVQEVVSARAVDRTGKLPDYVLGFVEHRGATVPVVDLRLRFRCGQAPTPKEPDFVFVASASGRYALAVDAVVGLVRLGDGEIRPAPELIQGGEDSIRGLALQPTEGQVLIILDLARVVRPEHVEELQQMTKGSALQDKAPEGSIDEAELMVFSSGGAQFALESGCVREILRAPDVVWVPHAPDFIAGVFQLRGEVLPVVDLRRRLGLAHRDGPKLAVIEDQGRRFGLRVDDIVELRRVARGSITPPPAIVQGVQGQFLSGICPIDERTVLLLDPGVLVDKNVALQPAQDRPEPPNKRAASRAK